ncbi:MBL fold metallo-hydrolase [Sphingobacterium sp. LRF_L2]|uniref:MBL fold metallo-hydrolase n=1 Tax=Sphingobacterium sp. LRF_L2 TaxID=3369421 RepID=UPI003F5E6A2B
MRKLGVTFVLVTLLITTQAQTTKKDTFRLIRNATMIFNYAGHKILVDPMLSPKGAFGSIGGEIKSPTVDLPVPVSEIVENIDLVLITHTHPDHLDAEGIAHLDKNTKLINQPADEEAIQKLNFTNQETLTDATVWKNIKITRTIAEHGTGRVLDLMGKVSGFILEAENHPTIYIVGDAVWTDDIYQNIKKYQPNYIIVNSGGAKMPGFDATPIIMDEQQTMSLIQESGDAKVIAIHMDAIDHCRTTREILKKEAQKYNISSDKLLIPADGAFISLH